MVGFGGCKENGGGGDAEAKIFFFINDEEKDGGGGYDAGTLNNYTVHHEGLSFSVKQIHADPDGDLLVPGTVIIAGEETMFQQCGTYDITINDNGVVYRFPNFVYQGEQNRFIARGRGWSMYISRDDWKQ